MTTKKQLNIFEFRHENGDVFTYNNLAHEYKLNGVELPGTTTPLTLVNEVSWDANGKMSDKTGIIKNWAINLVTSDILEKIKGKTLTEEEICVIVLEAKKKPNQRFKDAGISGTTIHEEIEDIIKTCIDTGMDIRAVKSEHKQVQNFVDWAIKNDVKFLFSEEPIYSKEWMNCGTVDFICEIDGKVLVGDIKTNGDKRRYEWNTKTNSYNLDKPVSDIHIPALWQTGAYGKMATEVNARKLIDKFDGVVVVNIKKSGEFDEKLDVRYDYNVKSLIEAYDHVIGLYKMFRNKYN